MRTRVCRAGMIAATFLSTVLFLHAAPAAAQVNVSIPSGMQFFGLALSVTIEGGACTVGFTDPPQAILGIRDGGLGKFVRWILPVRNPDQSLNRFGQPANGEPAGIDIHQNASTPDFVSGHPGAGHVNFYEWTIARTPAVPGTPDKYDIHAFRSTDGGATWSPCVVNDPTIANDNGAELTKPKKHHYRNRNHDKKPSGTPG